MIGSAPVRIYKRMSTPGRVFAITLFAIFFYALMVAMLPADVIKYVFDSLAFGGALTLFIVWTRDAIRAVHSGDAEPAEMQFLIALAGVEGVLTAQRLYAIIYFWMDRPLWLANSFFGSIWGYSFFVTSLLFMLAPGTANPTQKGRSLVMAGISIAIGALTAGILIGFSIATEVMP